MHSFSMEFSAASCMALDTACISPQLLVGRPLTGCAVFLEEHYGSARFLIGLVNAFVRLQCMTLSKINTKSSHSFWPAITLARAVGIDLNKTFAIFQKTIFSIHFHLHNFSFFCRFLCNILWRCGSTFSTSQRGRRC